MFSPFSKLTFASSNPLTSAVVGLSLAAVGTAIYLSPSGHHEPLAGAATPTPHPTVASLRPSSTPTPSTTKTAPKPKATTPVKSTPTKVITPARGTTKVIVVHEKTPATVVKTTTTKTVQVAEALKHCSNFKYQQDAQAYYVANLSDPGALDGATGPNNGDGIACNQLPVDPNRAASIAVGAYEAPTPTAAVKTALVTPTTKYLGIEQDGLPGDTSMFDAVSTKIGKAPSSVGWFSGFDADYGTAQVKEAWSRGALPVITWMSVATTPNSGHDSSEYTLTKILDGSVDAYLYKYAGDVVRTNLPVVIRFDHEMNGNWYPWSAGMYNNTPAKYVAAWQHIWNIFDSVGANENVIWMWSPSRIDSMKPHATTGGGVGQTYLAEDYPGDKYVDWVGASMYMRTATMGPTYNATFGQTLTALKALCNKPIFIPETSAIQSDPKVGDLSTVKSQWIDNTFAGFLADPRIVGFMWFNNVATQLVNGVEVTNDWRLDSSQQALAAFQRNAANSAFAAGTAPDGLR